MPDVISRAGPPHVYLRSVNAPEYPALDWIHDPDLSAVAGFDVQYWTVSGDTVGLANQAARDAIDAANAAALVVDLQTESVADVDDTMEVIGFELRALIELFNKRDNYLTNRIEELQQDLQAIKATSGNAQSMRDAIRASYLATNTRPRPDAVQDYKDIINNGEVNS